MSGTVRVADPPPVPLDPVALRDRCNSLEWALFHAACLLERASKEWFCEVAAFCAEERPWDAQRKALAWRDEIGWQLDALRERWPEVWPREEK